MMNPIKKDAITTHILDLESGKPAVNVPVTLQKLDQENQSITLLGNAKTDADGRVSKWSEPFIFEPGVYQLQFDLFNAQSGKSCFFPRVELTFTVEDRDQHYHIPLLLSPYGYSTYRGS